MKEKRKSLQSFCEQQYEEMIKINNEENNERESESKRSVIKMEEALKYVSKYFIYHADQRLKTFRYFLVYLLAVSAGFYKGFEDCSFCVLLLGGLVSLVIVIVFWLLEIRNKQLIEIGSEACQLMETELVKRLPSPVGNEEMNIMVKDQYYEKLKIVTQGHKSRHGASYRIGIAILFMLAIAVHLFVIIAAMGQMGAFNFPYECKAKFFEKGHS